MLRVRTTFTGATGAPWLSTSYFFGDDTQVGADAAVAKVGAFWGAVDARMNTAIQWTTDPSVAVMTTAGEQTGALSTTPQSGTGGAVTELLPPANQALLRLRTNVFSGGREIRGRLFIPGLTEADASAGLVLAAARAIFDAAAVTFAAVTAPRLGVWSRSQSTVAAVQTGTVWSQFAVLRSRRD